MHRRMQDGQGTTVMMVSYCIIVGYCIFHNGDNNNNDYDNCNNHRNQPFGRQVMCLKRAQDKMAWTQPLWIWIIPAEMIHSFGS